MGGDGGGDGGFADRQKAEESRKIGLRQRINSLYGYGSGGAMTVDRAKFTTPSMIVADETGPQQQPETFDQAGYDAAVAAGAGTDAEAAAARAAMSKEETDLANANRNFYSEDLQHSYAKAKRNNTFALADRGLLGGKAQVDTEAELNRDNTLGGTRLEDEVRSAVASLKNQREGERLNALNLVNAGTGEEAIAGAQAGLSRSLQNATATRKANIAGDLFTTGADSVAAGNNAAMGGLAYQQYLQSLRRFSNPVSSVGAAVTPTN